MSTTLTPPAKTGRPNLVKIGSEYWSVATLKEAVQVWVDRRTRENLGASESPKVTACIDQRLYRISYNGRVWDAGTGEEVTP